MKKIRDFYNSLSDKQQIILQAVVIGVVFVIGCATILILEWGTTWR